METFFWCRNNYLLSALYTTSAINRYHCIFLLHCGHNAELHLLCPKIISLFVLVIKTSNDASVMSRTFACIADVLGCKADNNGGLRSGPAANFLWKKGLTLLEVKMILDKNLLRNPELV